jgi:WD repeat-containing protein 48
MIVLPFTLMCEKVQEKLEKLANSSNSGTPRTSQESGSGGIKPKPEDLYEILCNDTLLPLNMTLAAARQYVWRQAPELIMYYRKRMAASPHPKGSLAAGSQQQ